MTLRPPRDWDRDHAESVQLIDRLVAAVPEVRPLLDEHMRTNPELLPCVLVGDVSEWFVELHNECSSDVRPSEVSCALFERLGDFFEANYQDPKSDAVGDIIGPCFLEQIAPGEYAEVKRSMDRWPTLKAWLNEYGW